MRRFLLLLVTVLLLPLTAQAAVAAPAALRDRIDLPAGFAPEGIEAGGGTTVYVGSLATGAIWRGDVRTGRGSVFIPGEGKPAVGVTYDAGRQLLWVAGGPAGEVRAYSTVSGALVRTYSFSGSGFLNDLTVTDRAVYVTDSLVQRLDVIPFGAGGALPAQGRTLPLTGDIHYVAGQFNANGIVDSRGFLIIGQSVTSQLYRVNPMTGLSRLIDVPAGSLSSPDGLELHGRILYAVRNDTNGVAVLRLDPRRLAATELDQLTGDTDVPSTGTLVGESFYVVNARFGTPATPTTQYWISRVS